MPLFADETESTSEAIRQNIALVAKLEEKFQQRRSVTGRIADAIAAFCGSMSFVVSHLVLFMAYFAINAGWMPGIPAFDPWPFLLLSLIVSVEAIFLSTFVLMSQNRMGKRADSRAHLGLQINLLSEKEMTLVLQMLQVIGDRLGIQNQFQHAQLEQLSSETPIERLAEELEDKIPNP